MEAPNEEAEQPPRSYAPPSWSGPPKHSGYSVEVLKEGQVVQNISLKEKPFFTVGRHTGSDVLVEHPSLSRHHCVLQFSQESDTAYLCDLKSTHGTFLNKTRLAPFEHHSIADGEIFQLGFSKRLYVFNCKISEPEPTKDDATPPAKRARVKRRRKMVTWGMQEDARPDADDATEIDWRAHAETHQLTEKQQKIAEKIKKLERRKEKLEFNSKKIHEKEAQFEELTPTQIAALLSNERSLEEVTNELEDLEEAIQTSILEKLHPSKAKARAEARQSEAQSDSDDEFYDRSKRHKAAKQKAEEKILSAESLVKEREMLKEQRALLEVQGEDESEEEVLDQDPDALDAFMSALNTEQLKQKRQDHSAEVERIEQRLQEIEKLLPIVDPDAFFARK